MAIIRPVERRSPSVRALYVLVYAVLSLGALVMVYPMALMVAGSIKSDVDAVDVEIIPRYLYDDAVLYRKFLESKYSGRIMLFQQTHQVDCHSFRHAPQPKPCPSDEIAELHKSFREKAADADHQILAHTFGSSGAVYANTRRFRSFLREHFHDSIDALNRSFGTSYHAFVDIVPPNESELPSRRYQPVEGDFLQLYRRFKASRPARERIFVDLDGYYRQAYVKPMYQTIENYNRLHGTAFTGFEQILLDDVPPANPAMAKDWEYFVRNELNPAFIRLSNAPVFDDEAERAPHIQDQAPAEQLSVAGPRQAFEQFVREQTPDVWSRYAPARWPQLVRRADLHDFQLVRGSFLRDCLTINYLAVLDYVVLHGRGVINTVIYCLLAVVSQLLVNPLAAYALSRYRPPGTYKVLLFVMTTMAFPASVTMIPAFLLLRNLGLLNTFAALILPGLANGYWIFMLKGFFDSLPPELYEAADLDGAGEFRKFWMITLSLSKPILAVIALGAFTAAYSNFMFALIIIPDRSMWTLMVWLYELQARSPQGIVYASLCLAAIPTLMVFLLAQNVIMRGIVVPVEK